MTDEISLLDVGTPIVLTCTNQSGVAQDISWATIIKYRIKTPLLSVFDRTAALYTDGTDGKVTYSLAAADLVPGEGLYDIQVFLDGATWEGQSSSYQVYCRETNVPA